MVKDQLTTDIPPNKIRFHHILHDLEFLINVDADIEIKDFKHIHNFLANHYNLSKKELLFQGIRKAYRQIVEGI